MKGGERLKHTDLAADRAYSRKGVRIAAEILNYNLVVPPQRNYLEQWEYDRELYKLRNKIERLFGRIKTRFRKVFTRYDKLDIVYLTFVYFALIVEMLKISVNTP